MYLYSQVNRGVDQGSTTRDNYNVLTSQGIAERSVYTQGDYDWRTQPTAAQRANAANHKTTSPIYIFNGQNAGPNATAGIKSALAAGNPVLLAIPVYQGFYGLNALNSTFRLANVSGSNLGGHAITVMGYNSTGAIIQNSWGTRWGGSGFATIGWDFIERYAYEASYLTGFAGVGTPVASPTVTGVNPSSISTQGGTTITITGTNLGDPASTVSLVNADNTSQSVKVSVIARAGTSMITATTPVSPSGANAVPSGRWNVVVSTATTSSSIGSGSAVTWAAPTSLGLSNSVFPASGATVTVSGSGFGASSAAFTANAYSAKVNGVAAPLTWVSDTSLTMRVPAANPGSASVVLSRGTTVAGTLSAKYAAEIKTAAQAAPDATGSFTVAVVGKGLLGSTNWRLVSTTTVGGVKASVNLRKVTGLLAADTDPVVVVASDASATVRLPAYAGVAAGSYQFQFDVSPTYVGGVMMTAPTALVKYSIPVLSTLLGTSSSLTGGTRVTLSGTGFWTAVDPKIVLIPVSGGSGTPTATLVSATGTTLIATLPAASAGVYRVVVRTKLGETVNTSLQITYVAAPVISRASSSVFASAAGGSKIALKSTGFGASSQEFTANKFTATVNGVIAPIAWVSDTLVNVTVPAGKPGTSASIRVLRNNVPSEPVNVPVMAVITSSSGNVIPLSGPGVVTIAGVGFSGSGKWSLRSGTGTLVADLAITTSTAGNGVSVLNDRSASVRFSGAPNGVAGAYYLSFIPDQSVYPGATASALTGASMVIFTNLG